MGVIGYGLGVIGAGLAIGLSALGATGAMPVSLRSRAACSPSSLWAPPSARLWL